MNKLNMSGVYAYAELHAELHKLNLPDDWKDRLREHADSYSGNMNHYSIGKFIACKVDAICSKRA